MDGGGQIGLGRPEQTGVGRRPPSPSRDFSSFSGRRRRLAWLGGGARAAQRGSRGPTPNDATVLATCRRHFLSIRASHGWGFLGLQRGSAIHPRPTPASPASPTHSHPLPIIQEYYPVVPSLYTLLSLSRRAGRHHYAADVDAAGHDSLMSDVPSSAAAVASAAVETLAAGGRQRQGEEEEGGGPPPGPRTTAPKRSGHNHDAAANDAAPFGSAHALLAYHSHATRACHQRPKPWYGYRRQDLHTAGFATRELTLLTNYG